MIHTYSRGFSLVELISVIAICASMTALLTPAMQHMRSQTRGMNAESNLAMIGQASAMYAMDNEGRIATYTWRGDNSYINLSNGQLQYVGDDVTAAARQLRDILYRATGRLAGQYRIETPFSIIVQRRYAHLVLADYMGSVGQPIWAHPDDYNQLVWQQFPLHYSLMPHGQGSIPPGYAPAPSGTSNSIRQLWAFGSSFQTVPHAWMPDTAPTFAPISETPHLFQTFGGFPYLGDRTVDEVRFPSNKVMMFSEFDHDQVANPYFAYDHAAPEKLMFDGSINTMASGQAMPSASPAEPNEVWTQRYLPLDTFPIPLSGLGEQTLLNMRYRWTRNGLNGYDYGNLRHRAFRR